MKFFELLIKFVFAFYWIVINTSISQIKALSVNGTCGDPSVPHNAYYRPKTHYDGNVIKYYCENLDIDFSPIRNCTGGSWYGDQPVCGKNLNIFVNLKFSYRNNLT
jgi:hypothetical protein